MAEKNGIYKCEICGNVVFVIEHYDGELVCCGKPMKLLEEKTEDEGREKHVPVVEVSEGKFKVKVGSNPHPMEEDHYIELIQLIKDGEVLVSKSLKPGDEPVANFCIKGEDLKVRALCNIHGLWTS